MQKLTDFIVEKRYFILVIFLLLTGVSFYLSQKVVINHNIASYLPDNSETKIGNEIMEEEFPTLKSSDLNIMLEYLSKEEEKDAYNYLSSLDGVSDVTIQNKDNYTLYSLEVNDYDTSKKAHNVYTDVTKYFKDYDYEVSGSVATQNKDILPLWIVALAVLSALIILIIMSKSFAEPFIFLITILMAVVLNKGTNIIFKDVSFITSSIAAILQMALSMDYSIMLMNRYDEEKSHEKDKVKAMKKALRNAFGSISSSSLTTIVGLMALVFMSFKIGKDLGFVLAKGVFFSLFSVFFCLPTLILLFDKLITKTKKKSPQFNLSFLGKYSYKMRYVGLGVFILVFAFSFVLKNKLHIDYTDTSTDKIANTFEMPNEMAIIYPNNKEDELSSYCLKLQDNNLDVLCYQNTINAELTSADLQTKLNSYSPDLNINPELLKIIYYTKFNQANIKLNLNTLVTFTDKNILNNSLWQDKIPTNLEDNLDTLKYFVSEEELNKKRSTEDLSKILDISLDNLKSLLVYYHSIDENTPLTLNNFVSFVNKSVLTNPSYAKYLSTDNKNNLILISNYLNKEMLQTKYNYQNIANILNIDASLTQKIYLYYLINSPINNKMTLREFTDLLLKVQENSEYQTLDNLTNKELINKQMSSIELTNLFLLPDIYIGIITNIMQGLNKETLSPYEFVTIILQYPGLDNKTLEKINMANFLMTSTLNDTKFTYEEVSNKLNIPLDQVKMLYSMPNLDSLTLTPLELIDFIIEHQNDNDLKEYLDSDTIYKLNTLKTIMMSILNDTTYTSKDLALLLNTNESNIKLIYSLYDLNNGLKINLSLKDLVEFINNKVLTNKDYSSLFKSNDIKKIKALNNIIKGINDKKTYTNKEAYNLLKDLSSDLNEDTLDLVYLYYGVVNNYDNKWTMNLDSFITYLDELLENNKYQNLIDADLKDKVSNAQDKLDSSKELLVGKNYSRIVINSKLAKEGDETFNLIKNIDNDLKDTPHYLIGTSMMAYELSNSFDNELNLITVLTMLFIFLIVAITFKSLIIPSILVLVIECAVYLTMSILMLSGGSVYFIALLIVQSILMGATIDYAIVYTTYYLEARRENNVKESIILAYNNSIHTILTSALILILVTLIVGYFASEIAGKICLTISEGTIVSSFLILLLLPELIALFDKFIVKKKLERK